MEIEVIVKKKIEVRFLSVRAGVRYWEDAEVNGIEDVDGDLIPFRKGNNWCPVINLSEGKIVDWPKGTTASIHYKVCDQCSWALLNGFKNLIINQEDQYVPSILCPEDEGFGDYIIMEVDAYGVINKFNKNRVMELAVSFNNETLDDYNRQNS